MLVSMSMFWFFVFTNSIISQKKTIIKNIKRTKSQIMWKTEQQKMEDSNSCAYYSLCFGWIVNIWNWMSAGIIYFMFRFSIWWSFYYSMPSLRNNNFGFWKESHTCPLDLYKKYTAEVVSIRTHIVYLTSLQITVTPCSRCVNCLLTFLHVCWWTGMPLDNEHFSTQNLFSWLQKTYTSWKHHTLCMLSENNIWKTHITNGDKMLKNHILTVGDYVYSNLQDHKNKFCLYYLSLCFG